MKVNYFRFISLLVVIFLSLLLFSKWQKSTRISERNHTNTMTKTEKTFFPDKKISENAENYDKKFILINTKKFKDLRISLVDGAVYNAAFSDYKNSVNNNTPMSLLNSNYSHFYTAESKIILNGKNKKIIFTKNLFQRLPGGKTKLTLLANLNNFTVERSYIFSDNSYSILTDQIVKNNTKKDISICFGNQITRRIKSDNNFGFLNATSYAFKGLAFSSDQIFFKKKSFDNFPNNSNPVKILTNEGWIAFVQHYFVTVWLPHNLDMEHNYIFYIYKLANNIYRTKAVTNPAIMPKNTSLHNSNILYSGPTITKNLNLLSNYFGSEKKPKALDKIIDYGLLSFISVLIFKIMKIIHRILGNWGLSIIATTIFIKAIFYPLSVKSYKSMAKLRLLHPRIKKLQELYKDDKQELGKKMLSMYRNEKVSPASGCFPVLIQIPVFIALYWVLLESVELRQAPFLFWINDLSSRDPFFVLPILMGFSMLIQQRISPSSSDPIQSKIMLFMPVVFTIFFLSFPSGLVLYWLTNNCFSIFQQWLINRKYILRRKHQD